MPPYASPSCTSITQPALAEIAALEARAGKYLIFRLGSEEFGIKVIKVREIMGIQDVTPVPQTPAFIKGVINLRGKVIPVVDLRLKFDLASDPYTPRTCIIVVKTELASDELMMGVIVDEVVEVLNLVVADIEDTPDFGSGVETPFLLGMAKVKDKVKILLDIDEVLNNQELQDLEGLVG